MAYTSASMEKHTLQEVYALLKKGRDQNYKAKQDEDNDLQLLNEGRFQAFAEATMLLESTGLVEKGGIRNETI